ncbi:MAG: hypothetical protein ACNI3A_12160 [Desulfovibrio sp.]|uniref:hypothetical protein n=1 Tax=Desulfovibrio sp. 7SRBS1 TaxID=3378064 RepID=UPI003B3D2D1F
MNNRRTLPAIPDVPDSADPMTAPALRALKEIIEVREGLRGNPQDKAVTLRDLYEMGLIQRK